MSRRIVLKGGAIYLGSGRFYRRGYVRIEGQTIVEVGDGDFARTRGWKIVDIGGGLVLPGFSDSHIHLVAFALSRSRLDLSKVESLEEALVMIGEHARKLEPGQWLLGRGWDKQRWHLEHFPDRWMLDRVVSANPVALDSHDGHLVWTNSAAIAELGLEEKLPEIKGGRIEIDSQGRPTGIFMEKAVELVRKRIGHEEDSSCLVAISEACNYLASLGITYIHTIEGSEYGRCLDMALRQGMVGIRLFRMQEIGSVSDLDKIQSSTQCIKLYADGALGSQTAFMFEPYEGQPENLGVKATESSEIEEIASAACARGLAVAVHAIGDRANTEVLDAYEHIRKRYPDACLRIEHAQVLRERDIARFATLGIIASMQPIHVVSDMDVASHYWGNRCRYAYAWRSLLAAGAVLAFGSDAPIEEPDPLKGIHAAVTRRRLGKRNGKSWYAEQCLTVGEAIDCYTIGAAIASGQSDSTGSITAGKRADLTVLSNNILDAGPDSVLETRVWMTIIDGRIVYSA